MVTNTELERAQRVADTLNRCIGTFHAARCTMAVWINETNRGAHPSAAKHSLQMTFGSIALMLRKFEDLWNNHICCLIPAKSPSRADGQWILDECKGRNLRTTVNRLFAHYAARNGDLPLSTYAIVELIKSNGWQSEEEFLEWSGPVLARLIAIRDDLMLRHGIISLTDEKVAE
jgi:hypothetical protein